MTTTTCPIDTCRDGWLSARPGKHAFPCALCTRAGRRRSALPPQPEHSPSVDDAIARAFANTGRPDHKRTEDPT